MTQGKAAFTKKVRKVAGVLVVTIPTDVVNALNLKESDYVGVEIEKIHNNHN